MERTNEILNQDFGVYKSQSLSPLTPLIMVCLKHGLVNMSLREQDYEDV